MENKKTNLFSQFITEYKKVHWADKTTVFQVTIIVLLITLFVALYVTVFDFAFKNILDALSGLLKKILRV